MAAPTLVPKKTDWRVISLCAIVAAAWLFYPSVVRAQLGIRPEAQEMIDKGLKFLETSEDKRVGGKCLGALCFLKTGRDKSHPKVQEALAACRSYDPAADNMIYSLGIAIMFLAELDDQESKPLASNLLKTLVSLQQTSGGWGYRQTNSGDISQTQYGTLALWTAYRHGLDVPQPAVERLCDFLMRSQDPAGGFGYQARVAPAKDLVTQSDIFPSLSAAGLGSAYICADLLRVHNRQAKPEEAPTESEESKLPPAVQVTNAPDTPAKRIGFTSKAIRPDVLRRTLSLGDQWMAKNAVIPHPRWNFYYLYGLERYYSFREVFEGKSADNPEWYEMGLAYLKGTQSADGSWIDQAEAHEGRFVHTSFAVLFLCRSSKVSIRKVLKNLGDGVLVGGMGLPKNVADIRETNGKIAETPLAGSVDELLALLDDPKTPDLASLAESQQVIKLDPDVTKREGQIAKLRAMVSAGNYESRIVAVRSLAKTRDMKNVPMLLYALSDPDLRVCVEADKGLKYLSRKFAGVGLTLPATRQDVDTAAAAWRKWYLSVQPDAELLD